MLRSSGKAALFRKQRVRERQVGLPDPACLFFSSLRALRPLLACRVRADLKCIVQMYVPWQIERREAENDAAEESRRQEAAKRRAHWFNELSPASTSSSRCVCARQVHVIRVRFYIIRNARI